MAIIRQPSISVDTNSGYNIIRVMGRSSFLDRDIDSLSSENIRKIISHLETENDILMNIMSGTAEGIIVTSPEGTILFANDKAYSLLDMERNIRNLKNLRGDTPLFKDEENACNSSSVIRRGKKILRVISEPLKKIYLFFITDLTDIYATRKVISDNVKYLSNMLTFLNYEINNPLQRMNNLLQILEADRFSISDEQLNILKSDIREIDKTLSGFSKSVTDNPYLFKRFSPSELIQKSIQIFKYNAEEKDLRISFESSGELPHILGNFNSLQQALSNIIANAIEASSRGSLIKITAENDKNSLYVSVKDSGRGISFSEIHSIFEPFFSTKEERRGLGLTIAARIIYNHLGTISVSSLTDQGTQVSISIPIRSETQPSLTYDTNGEDSL